MKKKIYAVSDIFVPSFTKRFLLRFQHSPKVRRR